MARYNEETMAGRIRSLDIGQSFSRTHRVSLAPGGEMPDLTKVMLRLRNGINQVVGRVRNEIPDNIYRVESASGITADGQALLATVAVTRLGEGGDEEEDYDI